MSLLGIQPAPIKINETFDQIAHFREFNSGAGANVVKQNVEGFFAGATNFTDAPFSVNYSGNMKATSGTFGGSLSAATGTFTGKVEIKDGSGNVVILIDPNASS